MHTWRALAGAACAALLCSLAAAAAGRLSADDQETCFGALDALRGCSAGMVPHDLQEHCCIPFHALEGMSCFWCVPLPGVRHPTPNRDSSYRQSSRIDLSKEMMVPSNTASGGAWACLHNCIAFVAWMQVPRHARHAQQSGL